jgi:hypothetical protein
MSKEQMYKQVVHSRQFYTAYFIFVFASFFPQYWQASFKAIGQFYGHTDLFMTASSSFALVGNMGSRLGTGIMIDKIGFKKVALMYAFCAIILGMTFDSVGES